MSAFRVLSLDGGGVRCLLGVALLTRLERALGRPLHEVVDLVIGTSAGAITGCCLSMGMPAAEIGARWEGFCRTFFPHPRGLQDYARRVASLAGLVPKYGDAAIEGSLKELFGERTLGELLVPHTFTVAFDPGLMQVFVFRSSDPEHAAIPVWQACRASGAGPTYFSEAGPRHLLDGGVIANNPTTFGVLHGIRLAREAFGADGPERLLVISIGSGVPVRDRTAAHSLVDQARRLMDIVFYADLAVGRYLLPERNYFRLQPALPPELAVTDDHRRLPELRLVAESFADSVDATLHHIAERLQA
jgi:uncharacterized protein